MSRAGTADPLQTVVRFARHMLSWFGNATAKGACLNIRDCHAPKERSLPRACAVADDGGLAAWDPQPLPAIIEIVRSVFFVEELWLPGYAIHV